MQLATVVFGSILLVSAITARFALMSLMGRFVTLASASKYITRTAGSGAKVAVNRC